MKIISLANQKGGCGKSTIALNLAMNFASRGKRVILLDTDPQQSCVETLERRSEKPIKVIPIFSDIHLEVQSYQDTTDYVVIDTPPHDGATMASTVICSDLVIIPVQDSPLDIRSTKITVDLVKEAQEINKTLKVYFLLSRIQPKTIRAKELAELLFTTYGIQIL
ncbi:MAG: ParA family protein, partial [Desulfobacterales bacterium]|nr:ParA family protein [Desulfobacterales bacterium]